MSERRERRRLHARARALGVPIEQARRRPPPQPTRPTRPMWPAEPAEPAWPRTVLPDRDEDRSDSQPVRAPSRCCTATRTREVLAGGTVVMLTLHATGCPLWTAR